MRADYEFYKEQYFGNVISQDDFPKYESRACDKIDYLTMDKFAGVFAGDNETLQVRCKKAICIVAEIMYDIESAEKAYRKSVSEDKTETGLSGRSVKSVSSGNESITYSDSVEKTSVISAVLTDKVAQDRLIFDSIRDYLGGTGLLSQAI